MALRLSFEIGGVVKALSRSSGERETGCLTANPSGELRSRTIPTFAGCDDNSKKRGRYQSVKKSGSSSLIFVYPIPRAL